jgi:transposase
MRGDDNQQEGMFSYISPEKRVPEDHPLRPIRKMVDEILKEMSPRFAKLYSDVGRPSIAPERLFRSLLLQIFYSVRSERMLIEQLQYNLLFRWFVGMEMDETVWNHAVYSKNRERLLNEGIAEGFFQRVLERARPYISDEHFTVDGTLIEAWASHKSFRPKDGAGLFTRMSAYRIPASRPTTNEMSSPFIFRLPSVSPTSREDFFYPSPYSKLSTCFACACPAAIRLYASTAFSKGTTSIGGGFKAPVSKPVDSASKISPTCLGVSP